MMAGKKEHSRPGRPTLLTPATSEAILKDIALGISRKTAALCNGVSPGALKGWCRRGRKEEDGASSIYSAFWTGLKKAEQDAIRRNVAIVQKVAAGGFVTERRTVNRADGSTEVIEKVAVPEWTAAAWTLERLNPERWGRDVRELRELRRQVAELAALLATVSRGPHTNLPDPPAAPPAPVPA